jgi:hypothetical protein
LAASSTSTLLDLARLSAIRRPMLPKPTKATFRVGSPDDASMPLSTLDDDDDMARAQTRRELSHATATTVRFANDGTAPRPRREALHVRLRSDNESMFRCDQWEILYCSAFRRMCVIVMVGGRVDEGSRICLAAASSSHRQSKFWF